MKSLFIGFEFVCSDSQIRYLAHFFLAWWLADGFLHRLVDLVNGLVDGLLMGLSVGSDVHSSRQGCYV